MEKELRDCDIENIAMGLIDLLIEEGLWTDVIIYCLGHAYCTEGYCRNGAHKCFQRTSNGIVRDVYVKTDVYPEDYVKWYSKILTVTFETTVYKFLYSPLCEKLDSLVNRYDLYFDIGEHWNMGVYHI